MTEKKRFVFEWHTFCVHPCLSCDVMRLELQKKVPEDYTKFYNH